MSLRANWIVRASLGLAVSVGVAQGAAFSNGSFEFGTAPGVYSTLAGGSGAITDWTVTGASIDYIGTYWQPGDGARSLDLNGLGTGGIQQTFDTLLGQKYAVTFLMAGNPDGPPAIKTLNASAGLFSGNFTAPAGTKSNMGWTTKSFTFVAQGTSTTLTFASLDPGAYGAALDRVTLTPVPEPFTLGLTGASLIVALRRWNRRRS